MEQIISVFFWYLLNIYLYLSYIITKNIWHMKKHYTPFFGLLLAVLMYSGAQAQTVIHAQYRPVQGLSDPELPDPRYAAAGEVAELREQIQLLTDAYSRLVEQHNIQTDRLQALERQVHSVGPPPARQLPNSVLSIRKL